MADIRINALATTATTSASDDYVAIDGSANGTRKLSAYSPTFGGNLTVNGSGSIKGDLSIYGGNASSAGSITANSAAGGLYFYGQGTSTNMRFYTTDGSAASQLVMTLDTNKATTLAGNLTVSGTGTSSVAGSLSVGTRAGGDATLAGDVKINQSGSGVSSAGGLEFKVDASGSGYGYRQMVDFDGSSAYNFVFQSRSNSASWTTRMVLASSGNLLLGNTVNATGLLQLGTTGSTTSAGGIGFGTDTFLYRAGSSSLAIDGSGDTTLLLRKSGALVGQITGDGANLYIAAPSGDGLILQSSNTTALTLDSSQNATFAGTVTANGGYYLNGVAGTNRGFSFYTSSVSRWYLYEDSTAESGSNAGSDIRFARYDDGGGYLAQVFEVKRSTGLFTFNSQVALTASTPASASATGVAGTITWDASYIYVCTATNTWKRVAIATW